MNSWPAFVLDCGEEDSRVRILKSLWLQCSTKNPTGRHIQLAVRNCWWASLLQRLVGMMVQVALQLATAPPVFPAGKPVFSARRAEGCGFARADSVRGSGVAVPERCLHCSVQDWQPTRTGSAPTLPRKGLCGSATSPARVFSSPALGTGCGALLPDQGHSSRQVRLLLRGCAQRPKKPVLMAA
jgi:hypothetical protein